VVARASRIRCGLVFGSEGSQGLCQIGEPSYLLEADDCDGTVLVVVMIVVMIVNGKNCVHWFLLITIILIVLIHVQCIAKPHGVSASKSPTSTSTPQMLDFQCKHAFAACD
jgi:hypothetical protein